MLKTNKPTAEFELNHEAIKKDSKNNYDSYLKIKSWFDKKQLRQKEINMFHPGSGNDIVSPLLIYDAIVSSNKVLNMVCIDTRDFSDGIILHLKKYTKDPIIKKVERKGKQIVQVAYKDKQFNIIFYTAPFGYIFPSELVENIDIYYERGFEMFRSNDYMAMYKVYANIKKLGLMITDHSFYFGSHANKFKRIKGLPKQFGFYENFQIWQRTND